MRGMWQLSIVKTLRFNLRYFGLRGLKLPVLVSKNVRFQNLRGEVKIASPIKFGQIKLGFDGTGICDFKSQHFIWNVNGIVLFNEGCNVAAGVKFGCGKDAKIILDRGVTMNVNSQIICMKEIHFGTNAMISWDCLIMDSDFHNIIDNGELKQLSLPINIGDNVWVACRSVVLKGVKVADGCVIAANSTITKSVEVNNCLISSKGVIKENISWQR